MKRLRDYAEEYLGPEWGARFLILLENRPKYIKALLILRRLLYTNISDFRKRLRMSPKTMRYLILYLTGAGGAPKLMEFEKFGSERGKYVFLTKTGRAFADNIVNMIKEYAADIAFVQVERLYGASLDTIAENIGARDPKKVVVIEWSRVVTTVSKEYPKFPLAVAPEDIDAKKVKIAGKWYYAFELRRQLPPPRW